MSVEWGKGAVSLVEIAFTVAAAMPEPAPSKWPAALSLVSGETKSSV